MKFHTIPTPLGAINVITDESFPKDAMGFVNFKYKWIPVEGGMREEIDWDATAKTSAAIYNIGERK